MSGTASGMPQYISGRYWVYTYKDIIKGATSSELTLSLNSIPSKIYVSFQTQPGVDANNAAVKEQSCRRIWNHQDIKQVVCNINSKPVNSGSLMVNDWTSQKDARALYEHFIMSSGQSGFNGNPAITFDEFCTNYCFWTFDTSKSVTGMLELHKEQANMQILAYFASGTAFKPLRMQAFIVYDGLYTISGPMDVMKSAY